MAEESANVPVNFAAALKVSANGRYYEHASKWAKPIDGTSLTEDGNTSEYSFVLQKWREAPFLLSYIEFALETISRDYLGPHLSSSSSKGKGSGESPTIYAGNGGIVLAYYLAEMRYPESDPSMFDWKELYEQADLESAEHLVQRGKRVTFLEGAAGILALRAVRHGSAKDNIHLDHLLELGQQNVLQMATSECEILYGRAGYLYALLFVRKCLGLDETWGSELEQHIILQIMEEGARNSGDGEQSLLWYWHQKMYLGAAHGIAGISYILLECSPEVLQQAYPQTLQRIQSTIDNCLLKYRFQSGNFPSSLENESDRLVHFCHGATGWVPLLLKMAQTFPNSKSKYMQAASDAAEVVWERGLLAKKGPGLCHGIGGSICALLDMYTYSRDEKWLQRALYFGLALIEMYEELTEFADRPFSLFEGLAGTYYALAALLALCRRETLTPSPTQDPSASHTFTSCFPGLGV